MAGAKGASALMKYFGRKSGQSIPQFAAEVNELGNEDREELVELAVEELSAA